MMACNQTGRPHVQDMDPKQYSCRVMLDEDAGVEITVWFPEQAKCDQFEELWAQATTTTTPELKRVSDMVADYGVVGKKRSE